MNINRSNCWNASPVSSLFLDRLSLIRGYGFKGLTYTVNSWLVYENDPENDRRQYATWFYSEEGRGSLEHLL